MNQDLDVVAAHQTQLVALAVRQLGRALLVGSLVGLVATFVVGLLAVPLAGLVVAAYLLRASAPELPKSTADDRAVPVVAEE